MPRVLIVSHASINAPHRKPYDLLGQRPGWNVHIAAPRQVRIRGESPLLCAPVPETASYQLHRLDFRGIQTGRFVDFSGINRLIWRLRPDVIFAEYDPGSMPVLKIAPLAKILRIPIVAFTVENILRNRLRDSTESIRRYQIGQASKDIISWALGGIGEKTIDSLACVSQQGMAIFGSQNKVKRVSLMPIGTDLERFRPMDNTALKTQLKLNGSFVVGYFGRLVPEKGIEDLLGAVSVLPKQVVLLLDFYSKFAPGSYAEKVLSTIETLGIRSRVTTIDVGHEDVPRYMNCCDVLVLASKSTPRWKEQFGRVLPEAMACGVPVIGTRSGNIPDMIGDAGVLFEEGDEEGLAAAITGLLHAPQRRRELAEAGQMRVRERFSSTVQAELLADILGSVTAQARSHR